MTKRDKIYEACELTELGRCYFSCTTIDDIFGFNTKVKYKKFIGGFWPWDLLSEFFEDYYEYSSIEAKKSIRIMAMLLFLETEPESLDGIN